MKIQLILITSVLNYYNYAFDLCLTALENMQIKSYTLLVKKKE